MKYGGVGKPYIFSTSNCIFNGMPTESYRIMLDEYQQLIKTWTGRPIQDITGAAMLDR
jgi:hypothetical protein